MEWPLRQVICQYIDKKKNISAKTELIICAKKLTSNLGKKQLLYDYNH